MNLGELLLNNPAVVDGVSKSLGLDARSARSGVEALLPGLARGMQRNAQQPGGLDGFLFGQQHANWDSKRFRTVDDRILDWRGPRAPRFDGFVSDIELATTLMPGVERRTPAVYGFSLRTALRLGPEEQVRYADQIVEAYAAGGVVTIHFPADNPVTGGDHKDVSANALCALSTDWNDPAPSSCGVPRAATPARSSSTVSSAPLHARSIS